MNENIDLCEILKDCPKGTKLYSSVLGEVRFYGIDTENNYVIKVVFSSKYIKHDNAYFTKEGKYLANTYGECVLFPSKDQRDWSTWKCPKTKFDPKTLKAFDKVLARIGDGDAYCWFADFVSVPALKGDTIVCVIGDRDASMIIPYNEETKYLVGTNYEAPEYYRYWED